MFVKICGITCEEDALLAVAMGADAVGFIFAAGSTRQITPETAGDIAKRLPPEVVTVGVFRGDTPQRIVDAVHKAGLRAAQLNGRETPQDSAWIRRRIPMLIKTFAAGDPAVRNAADYGADVVMLDAGKPGSGQVFDWLLAEDVPQRAKLLLAGGLNEHNVADAIAQVRPWGVDVATGVESSPGRKDARKVRAFIAAARAAAPVAAEPESGPEPYDWQADG